MCGIAGQLKIKDSVDRALVKKMTDIIIHRGPDGDGFYFSDRIGMGMRRLKIIDLVTGDQPIHNEDKMIWTVFNGEIYNFQKIRKELEAVGHVFYTKSDTEVIVHAYEQFGENFVSYLNGMFSLAVWDETKKKLILARDRVGEKPLYYYYDGETLLFASELKSILCDNNIKREINLEALHYYFIYGRVPSPYCIIKNIKKLEPASVLIFKDNNYSISKYWQPSFAKKTSLNEEEIKKEIVNKLRESVKMRMMADVPLGSFLSGGVDSSAVVAMMAQVSSRPIETFTIGFKEQDFSELKYARMVAERLGANHHEFIIEPEVMEILPKLVWHLDEPFADASIIPTYYVSKVTRDFVTVALTGDGGDELFAGYESYKAIKIAGSYNKLPKLFREAVYNMIRLIPDTDKRDSILRYLHKIKRLAETQRNLSSNPLDIFLGMTSGFTEKLLIEEVYNKPTAEIMSAFSAKKIREDHIKEYDGDNASEALLYSQFCSLLPDMFFTKVDRCSMAVSLETRSPFVDHDFVEFVASIPFGLKLKGLETKYILKQALKNYLPDEILFRRKMGFGIPLHRWIKEGKLRDEIKNTLLDKAFIDLGYFNVNYIKKIIAEHNSGQANNFDKIWRLYMFALWYNIFITSKK